LPQPQELAHVWGEDADVWLLATAIALLQEVPAIIGSTAEGRCVRRRAATQGPSAHQGCTGQLSSPTACVSLLQHDWHNMST
jgi:hypothetical protein